MMPTFSPGMNIILGDCLSIRLRLLSLQRGDVVTFLKPTGREISVCKRIIGLLGDIICVNPDDPTSVDHIIVPNGHVWVQGDNGPFSLDSRAYGPVPLALIRSKIIARVG